MARDTGESAVWFLTGIAVGAALGILFAPASGEETRKKLGKQAVKGKEYIEESGRELMDKGKELYEKGREMADEAAEMFERGRKMVQG